MKRTQLLFLLAAIFVALLVRAPGILWGYNFPSGWYGHHVDEYAHAQIAQGLIYPYQKLEWQHPYPKAMAAHVAVPVVARLFVERKLFTVDTSTPPLPARRTEILVIGRIWSAIYGALTVLVTFLLARKLFADSRIALVAAWVLALGGLHVTQSHFFLSDVPSIFWVLLGSLLLWKDLEEDAPGKINPLPWAAFCIGAAFGLKLTVAALPSLGLVILMKQPRIQRIVHAAVFFFAGFVGINLAFYSPLDLAKTFAKGVNDPFLWSAVDNVKLYLIEMPSILSLPVCLLAAWGGPSLLRKFLRCERPFQIRIAVVVLPPVFIHLGFVVYKLDHFARHIVPFIPWVAMLAAWSLVRAADALRARGLHPALLYAPVFLYLCVFVYDGERFFLREPRNTAAEWLQKNIPQGASVYWRSHTDFPGIQPMEFSLEKRPQCLVIEMYRVNPMLSGMSWKFSYPRDHRYIFEARKQEDVDAFQALFRGTSEYKEVASFKEGYFMPEFVWVERLIGNRSRNYLSEIVIFTRPLSQEETSSSALLERGTAFPKR